VIAILSLILLVVLPLFGQSSWLLAFLAILILPLWVVVHLTLETLYLALARRYCQRRGMTTTRYRVGPYVKDGLRQSPSLVELECQHPQTGRQRVLLVVGILGVGDVLSMDPVPDGPGFPEESANKGL